MGCKLVGVLGLTLQGIVAALYGSILLGKYGLERSEQLQEARPFWVFAMDCSKQVMGAAWIHVLNLVFAGVLAKVSSRGDECVWFWLNLMLDTTIGVLTEYILLQGINGLIVAMCKLCRNPHYANDWIESGDYFDKQQRFRPQRYFKQLFVWVVLIVSLMKASMVGLMLIFNEHLERLAEFALQPCMDNETTKLIVVSIITPGIMNAFQFWVVDNIIHRKPSERELMRRQLKDLDERYFALLGEPTTHLQQQGGERLTLQNLQEGLEVTSATMNKHTKQLKMTEAIPKIESQLRDHGEALQHLQAAQQQQQLEIEELRGMIRR